VHGLPDIDRAIPVSGKIAGLENACRNARREQFTVPFAVISVGSIASIRTIQYFPDAVFYDLKGVIVATCGECIAMLSVFLIIRIPSAIA